MHAVLAGQLEAFVDEVIGEPAVLVCNSVGGLAGLTLAQQVRQHSPSWFQPEPLGAFLGGSSLRAALLVSSSLNHWLHSQAVPVCGLHSRLHLGLHSRQHLKLHLGLHLGLHCQ
jgi:pimeloyl-ACP methyl ester carboxylesterase